MTLHFLAGYPAAKAWPISRPVQRLAGIRRLERNARRWRLWFSQMDLRGHWSSACPALLQCPRRSQVAPGFAVHYAGYCPIWGLMHHSTMASEKKIRTTHVGSLIRPPELLPFIRARQNSR